MFLGTYAPKLDDKGRVILPAKFRDELESGIVVTRGQERCLYVFSQREFEELHEKIRQAPVTSKQARDFLRCSSPARRQKFRTASTGSPFPPSCATTPASTATSPSSASGNRAEIWDTAAWETYYAEQRSRLRRHRRGGDPRTLLAPRP